MVLAHYLIFRSLIFIITRKNGARNFGGLKTTIFKTDLLSFMLFPLYHGGADSNNQNCLNERKNVCGQKKGGKYACTEGNYCNFDKTETVWIGQSFSHIFTCVIRSLLHYMHSA